jgi:hypothetical protein
MCELQGGTAMAVAGESVPKPWIPIVTGWVRSSKQIVQCFENVK